MFKKMFKQSGFVMSIQWVKGGLGVGDIPVDKILDYRLYRGDHMHWKKGDREVIKFAILT